MAVSGMLAVASLSGGGPAGCGAESNCGVVQASRFAWLLGVPVAAWGFGVYAALAAVALGVRRAGLHSRLALVLTGLGSGVSLYLSAISVVVLDAVCAWCLASLAIMLGCLSVATAQGWQGTTRRIAVRHLASVAVASLALIAGLHLYFTGAIRAERTEAELRALALHLRDDGARFYGAFWCPMCDEQKSLFGAAAGLLPYVECSTGGPGSPQTPACREAAIEIYPTWEIAGRRFEGLLDPEELAERSHFTPEAIRRESRTQESDE